MAPRTRVHIPRPRPAGTFRGRSRSRNPSTSRSRSVSLIPSRGYVSARKRARVNALLSRRPRSRNLASQAGVGGQLTYFKTGRPMKPYHQALVKNVTMQVHRVCRSARLEAGVGLQNISSYAIMRGGGYAQVNDSSYEIPYLLQQAVTNGLTSTATLADGTVNDTQKIFLHKSFTKYMITNQDIGNAQIHIFDIMTKRDYTSSPSSAFDAGIKDIGNSAMAQDSTALGLMPWSSPEFNTFFKVVQKTSLILSQGQSHTHIVSYKPNKTVTAEILKGGNQSLRGYTIYTMILAHGLPINDRDTKTNVSTGSISLDIVQTQDIHWTWMESNKARLTYNNQLPTILTEYEMNIGKGAAEADTQA